MRAKRKQPVKVVSKNSKKKRGMHKRTLADELNAFTGRRGN
jgi:hypothetical protein